MKRMHNVQLIIIKPFKNEYYFKTVMYGVSYHLSE